VSSNPHKIREVEEILGPVSIKVIPFTKKIEELQILDAKSLVKDKALKAFKYLGRPVFVEHTGLYLSYISGLPGGLTQIFWDALQAAKFSAIFGSTSDTVLVAKTIIGYVDGRNVHYFEGEVFGNVAPSPRGPQDFQWDCVFVPNGETRTFAEMGLEKNKISMRKRALDQFAHYLITH
jgi:XTP/dITP diphosphohydrolase